MARISIEAGGVTFVARVPTDLDLVAIFRDFPTLPTIEPGSEPGSSVASLEAIEARVDFANRTLARCCISPRVVLDNPAQLPPDTLPADEIDASARMKVANAILEAKGLRTEDAVALVPLSATSAS